MTTNERRALVEGLLLEIRDRVGELERLQMRGIGGRPLAQREEQLLTL